MNALIQEVKRQGGISPDKSGAPADWRKLYEEFRDSGYRGVVWANGNGRADDDLFADLALDLQSYCFSVSDTNHPLLDALDHELHRCGPNVRGETKEELELEAQALREAIHALEARLAVCEGLTPNAVEFSPQAMREAREWLNLTQEQALERFPTLGSIPTINRLETGKVKKPSNGVLHAALMLIGEALDAGFEVASEVPF